jgi:hypothetical protein
MRSLTRMHGALVAALAFGTLAVACSNSSSTAGGGGASLSIASPADGAEVSEPFTVKLDASVPLGDPSTGEDHVHLCFDGASCDNGDYLKVYSDSAEVQSLSPGQHTIEASLRNADHSAVGPTATITVTVTGGATSSGSPSSGGGYGGGGYGSPTSSASRGYGY